MNESENSIFVSKRWFLMFKVSMDDLINVLRDFHTLTGFLIVVFDAERRTVVSYPNRMCDFCSEVRKSSVLSKKCRASDELGFDTCDKSGKPCIYKCHMSVIEAISPIKFNDTAVGYLMFGQILGKDRSEVREKAKEANSAYGISITDGMIDSMTAADDEIIASAVNMMTMCAEYLYTTEIIKKDVSLLAERLKAYVSDNLSGDLSTENVCEKFYISRTKLYRLSADAFGMGFSDYVREERLKAAKKLLRNGESPVWAVAEAVGIKDSNYFVRLFKKREGVTPLQYRKAIEK